jgi:hypothetical protein
MKGNNKTFATSLSGDQRRARQDAPKFRETVRLASTDASPSLVRTEAEEGLPALQTRDVLGFPTTTPPKIVRRDKASNQVSSPPPDECRLRRRPLC